MKVDAIWICLDCKNAYIGVPCDVAECCPRTHRMVRAGYVPRYEDRDVPGMLRRGTYGPIELTWVHLEKHGLEILPYKWKFRLRANNTRTQQHISRIILYGL